MLAHARALLAGDPAGRTAYIEADVRDPDAILDAPEVAKTLDLSSGRRRSQAPDTKEARGA